MTYNPKNLVCNIVVVRSEDPDVFIKIPDEKAPWDDTKPLFPLDIVEKVMRDYK